MKYKRIVPQKSISNPDAFNHLDLRSDLENNIIDGCLLEITYPVIVASGENGFEVKYEYDSENEFYEDAHQLIVQDLKEIQKSANDGILRLLATVLEDVTVESVKSFIQAKYN